MLQRLHSTWLAGAGAVLLVLAMTGVAAAASLVTDTTPVASDPTEPAVSATVATFEDVNGDGIDDDCQTGIVAHATAITAAMAAVGVNAACTEDPETPEAESPDAEAPDDAPTAVCVATPVVVPPVVDPTVEVAPNAHGVAVSTIAHSDAVGGKNCNHGGAVSAAAHADKAAKADKADKADKAHVKKIHAAKTHGKPHAGQS